MLIGVDDAHLLDGLSAHVVHQLAQAPRTRLVVTVRAGGDEPDAITALWKDDLLARLDLEPLSPQDTHHMIETTFGGPVDSRSAKRFWKLTGGNALFLRQLLKDQIAAGAIRQVAGVWMWDERVAVSDSIAALVGRQLSRLTPDVALVVDTLSQYEPLAVDVLCDLVQRRDLEVAEQTNLVTVERSGSKLMAHWPIRCSVNFGAPRPADVFIANSRQAGATTGQGCRRRHACNGAPGAARPRIRSPPTRSCS